MKRISLVFAVAALAFVAGYLSNPPTSEASGGAGGGSSSAAFPYTGAAAISGSLAVTGSISATQGVSAVTGAFSGNVTAGTVNSTTIPSSVTLTKTSDNLSVFSATSSAQLFGVLNDETGGTGVVVGSASPTFTGTITAAAITTSGALTTNTTLANIGAGVRLSKITTGLTAHAGGGQGSATALSSGLNIVTTVGTAADSVLLITNTNVGEFLGVCNVSATSMNLFPPSTGNINGLSANAAIAVAANKCTWCYVLTATQWGCSTP